MAAPTRIFSNTTGEIAGIGIRLLDDAYLNWVAAAVQSEHALRAWFDAPAPHSRDAYLAYRAAADREQAAALDLERLSDLTRPCQEQFTHR